MTHKGHSEDNISMLMLGYKDKNKWCIALPKLYIF